MDTKKSAIQIVLVDKNDRVVGYKEKYETHKNPVPLHRAISVVITSKDGKKMLLQKRSKEKPCWPLFWTNACCTHPLPEESYQEAAERRLKEEMGFTSSLQEVFNFIYESKYDETWGEHELDHIFVGKFDGAVKPDPKEVVEYKWMEIEDLKKDIENNPNSYTPWFKIILKKP